MTTYEVSNSALSTPISTSISTRLYYLFLLSLSLLLAGCGFQLRGSGQQAMIPFKTVHLAIPENSPLSIELSRTPIRVTTLLPGFIKTDMSAGAGDDAALMASLDEGVSAMVDAIEKETTRAALPGLKWQGIDAALRFLPNSVTARFV